MTRHTQASRPARDRAIALWPCPSAVNVLDPARTAEGCPPTGRMGRPSRSAVANGAPQPAAHGSQREAQPLDGVSSPAPRQTPEGSHGGDAVGPAVARGQARRQRCAARHAVSRCATTGAMTTRTKTRDPRSLTSPILLARVSLGAHRPPNCHLRSSAVSTGSAQCPLRMTTGVSPDVSSGPRFIWCGAMPGRSLRIARILVFNLLPAFPLAGRAL